MPDKIDPNVNAINNYVVNFDKEKNISNQKFALTIKNNKLECVDTSKERIFKTKTDINKVAQFCSKNSILHPQFAENFVQPFVAANQQLGNDTKQDMDKYILLSQLKRMVQNNDKNLYLVLNQKLKEGKFTEEELRKFLFDEVKIKERFSDAVKGKNFKTAYDIARLFTFIPKDGAIFLNEKENLVKNPDRDIVLWTALSPRIEIAAIKLRALMKGAKPKEFFDMLGIIGKYNPEVRDGLIKEFMNEFISLLPSVKTLDPVLCENSKVDGKNLLHYFTEYQPKALPAFIAKLPPNTLQKLYNGLPDEVTKNSFRKAVYEPIKNSITASYNKMAEIVPNFKGKEYDAALKAAEKWKVTDNAQDMTLRLCKNIAKELHKEVVKRCGQNAALAEQTFDALLDAEESIDAVKDTFLSVANSRILLAETQEAKQKEPIPFETSLSLAQTLRKEYYDEIKEKEPERSKEIGTMYKNLVSRFFYSLSTEKDLANKLKKAGEFINAFKPKMRHQFFPMLDKDVRTMMSELGKQVPPRKKPAPRNLKK
jgi:hypothetical protein